MAKKNKEPQVVELIEEDLDRIRGGTKKKTRTGSATLQDLTVTTTVNKASPRL